MLYLRSLGPISTSTGAFGSVLVSRYFTYVPSLSASWSVTDVSALQPSPGLVQVLQGTAVSCPRLPPMG